MPAKIHYPKNNGKHKQKLIVIQGKCDDSAKVIGVLKKGGAVVNGQKLPSNAKSWAYRYLNLTAGDYNFKIEQMNSPTVTSTDSVDFNVNPPPTMPGPATPPTVTAPADSDTIASTHYPVGTSNAGQNITQCRFTGNGFNIDALASVVGPDANGDWSATVDASACPAGGGYTLTVSNSAGTVNVNNLTIAAP